MAAFHIYPLEDWIEHRVEGDQYTCDCLCEPRFELIVVVFPDYVHEQVLVIHNQVAPEDPEPEPWYWRLRAWLRGWSGTRA